MDLDIAIALSWSDIIFFNLLLMFGFISLIFPFPCSVFFLFDTAYLFVSPSQYISGSAYKIVNKRAYHHGTMLISTRHWPPWRCVAPRKGIFFCHLRRPDFFAKPCLSWINMHPTPNTQHQGLIFVSLMIGKDHSKNPLNFFVYPSRSYIFTNIHVCICVW